MLASRTLTPHLCCVAGDAVQVQGLELCVCVLCVCASSMTLAFLKLGFVCAYPVEMVCSAVRDVCAPMLSVALCLPAWRQQ